MDDLPFSTDADRSAIHAESLSGRRGEPMGVQIGDDGFPSYLAAWLAGGRALADFLEQLELEKSRTGRGTSQ